MVRYVSLLGLAFVALAAVALLTPTENPASRALPQPEPDRNDQAAGVLAQLGRRVIPAYAAGFSLN